MNRSLLLGALALALSAQPAPIAAQTAGPQTVGTTADRVPEQLRGIELEQRLGEQLPLETELLNSTGETVTLAHLLGERPALLVPVYYDCPMLCGVVLETLTKSLKTMKLEVGRDFDVIAFSFDPLETSEKAARARRRYVHDYDTESDGSGWHFLVGEPASVDRLTDAIGFAVNRDETTGEFAHAAAVFVLTPDGRIARLFFGLSYPPRDLRLALVEAGQGSIGNIIDQVLLYCFRYDPKTGRYSAAILRIVRTAGALTTLVIATFVFLNWRRERSRTLREQSLGGPA